MMGLSSLAGDFDAFFLHATGFTPYPYQRRLATGESMPSIVEVPTGLGKTEAVVLAWLWRRRFAGESIRNATPRRLVYCLPMRVLVEQTARRVRRILDKLGLLDVASRDNQDPTDAVERGYDGGRIAVSVLMGGEDEDDWDRWPERDAVLIGTQDMLLSRALNRGYAVSRFRWPVQFGQLNNDCLWVLDEVQLMGNGLATTTQLQAFRRKLGVSGHTHSIWMSATLNTDWLASVDFEPTLDSPGGRVNLESEDRNDRRLSAGFEATKPVMRAEFEATRDGKAEADPRPTSRGPIEAYSGKASDRTRSSLRMR